MSDTFIYDKAKYHYEGDFPQELDHHQAYVHTGMFLGWLCDTRLLSAEMEEDFASEIAQFVERKITGPRLLEIASGVLVSDMLSERGNAFAKDYYCLNGGRYLDDYADVLTRGLESLYHVEDTWKNYELLRERVDARYQNWMENRAYQADEA